MLISDRDEQLVSVVLPTFNRAALLPRAMASVLDQDYSNLELIVVDDGSTDSTSGTVAGFVDERVRYCRLDQQVGAAAARNAGIGLARGSLIAFQDSDDEWLPGKLSQQVRAIEEQGDSGGFVYTSFWHERNGFRERMPLPSQISRRGRTLDRLLYGNFVGTPTLLVSRSCLQVVGTFDETMQSLEDWELALRLSRAAEGIFIDEPLVLAHDTSSGVNSQGVGITLASLESIHRHCALEFRRERRANAEMHLAMGELCCRGTGARRRFDGISHFAVACFCNPSEAKPWVLLTKSLTGPRSFARLRRLYHRLRTRSLNSQ